MVEENTEPLGHPSRGTKEQLRRLFWSYDHLFNRDVVEENYDKMAGMYAKDDVTETKTTRDGVTTEVRSVRGQWEDKNHRWHLGNYSECMRCGERLSEEHNLCCGHGSMGFGLSPVIAVMFGLKGHECEKKTGPDAKEGGATMTETERSVSPESAENPRGEPMASSVGCPPSAKAEPVTLDTVPCNGCGRTLKRESGIGFNAVWVHLDGTLPGGTTCPPRKSGEMEV